MTKQEFVSLYQKKVRISSKKETERFVNNFFGLIEDVLVDGEYLSIVGFGKFEVATRSERVCRNPKTGEMMTVPMKKFVKFKAGKNLIDKVVEGKK